MTGLEKAVTDYDSEIKHATKEMAEILGVPIEELVVRDLIPSDLGLEEWVFPRRFCYTIPSQKGYLIWDIASEKPLTIYIYRGRYAVTVAVINSAISRKKGAIFFRPDSTISLKCIRKRRVEYVPIGVVIERYGATVAPRSL